MSVEIKARSHHQLLRLRDQLQEEYDKLDFQREQLMQEDLAIKARADKLSALVEANKAVLKANEVILHNIKRDTLLHIESYKKVSRVLSRTLAQDHDYDETYDALIGVQVKITALTDYFTKVFRMTPREYKKAIETKDKPHHNLN